jgi:plastocyanin
MRTRIVASAVAGVALLAACVGAERSGNVRSGPAGPGAVEVVVEGGRFRPEILELDAGSEVTVEVTNDDDTRHDFTVDDLDLSTGVLGNGEVASATLTVAAGTTEFRCTIHPGMTGEIVGVR